jgi:glycosyltransferase involved in cell wall biosynthesis
MQNYPKILIITETFKSNTGGGITMSNLFWGYPKDKLANAVHAYFIPEISSDEICDNFYSLGSKERKIVKLLSFIKTNYYSGKYIFNKNPEKKSTQSKNVKTNSLMKHFWNFVQFLGFNHYIFRTTLSDEFKAWVKEFSPDIIYSQLGSIENINFTKELVRFTQAKLAIHIMDDWTRVIGNYGIFRFYWNYQVEKKFSDIVSSSDICLSISEGMSHEYQLRYNRKFMAFHNPIDTSIWLLHSKKSFEIMNNQVKLLYAGRIGRGISESIFECIRAVQKLITQGYQVEFQIQTTSLDQGLENRFKTYDFVKVNPVKKYEELPEIFSSVDILLMPFDFNQEGMDFLRYSMPTKASEYMICGTPIIVFASEELSITRDAQKNKWAITVTKNDVDVLAEEIKNVVNDQTLRKNLSATAVKYAIENFDKNNVRNNFQKVFINSVQMNN